MNEKFNGLFLPNDVNLSSPPEYDNIEHGAYYSLNKEPQVFKTVSKKFFNDEDCENIIKLGKSNCLNNSTMGATSDNARLDNSYRSSYNSWIAPNSFSQDLYEKISDLVKSVNESIYQFDINVIEHLQYTEYPYHRKGHYGAHLDGSDVQAFYGLTRKLTFSIQLSDENSYEGGDLIFHTAGLTDKQAKREKGTITFFPSFMMHEVTPVTSGTRYSLVGWVHGPKWK